MVFKIDFNQSGDAVLWNKTSEDSAESTVDKDYQPRFYLEGDKSNLQSIRPELAQKRDVAATCFEHWRPTLSQPRKKILRIDTHSEEKLRKTVHTIKNQHPRHKYRFHNVDFSPQFRYCLQKNITPTPKHELTQIELSLSRHHQAQKQIHKLKINQQKLQASTNKEAAHEIQQKIQQKNPDIIKTDKATTIQLIIREIEKQTNTTPQIGRTQGVQKLAKGNTVNSYGKTVYKSSRFNIPGRILINKSNSFLLKETNIKGLWGLVERSQRPLQELAWSSIGRTLTSIETRRAYHQENTLTPWKNYNYETPKKASTLHKADTGGFIFNPEPSIHKDVYQADFASLFPNIMIKKNISPETVNCNCCHNQKTPELDYTICQKQKGFIPQVLKPLVEDRQEMKNQIKKPEISQKQKEKLKGRSDAIKWLLVSCFGYMGHAHASYGAIECHQAIQAYDREIMIKAKEMFEQNGYKVVHGIIDSLWLQKKNKDATPFKEVCQQITKKIGIELEPEQKYEWCAFVPRSNTKARIATLNRYFGKTENGEIKTAGIETEQSSKPLFIQKAQKEMIKALDQDMKTQDVMKVVKTKIRELENQNVPVKELVVEKTVSRTLENYKVKNKTYAAVKRAKEKHNIQHHPGQKTRYIVTHDQAKTPTERIKLPFEEIQNYDTQFYQKLLIKAAEKILSPKGIQKQQIQNRIKPKNNSNRKINKYS